jgi:methionyl-tRNA formyltransferase
MTAEARPLVFLGTPHAAAVVLERLVASGFVIEHVVTRPDARRGRGSATSGSPVKEVALKHGLEVSHDLSWIQHNAHRNLLGIVVAYGRIIPAELLTSVPMLNIHFSLLPRWRGAAPVERSILAGDTETGVCIMEVEPTLDTGAVYARRVVPISSDITAHELTEQLADVGADLLVKTLHAGLGDPEAQSNDATYASKISVDDTRIDWAAPSVAVRRTIRAVRAFTTIDDQRIIILESTSVDSHAQLQPGEISNELCVGTGDGVIRLVRVQPAGKPAMDAEAWWRGRNLQQSHNFA